MSAYTGFAEVYDLFMDNVPYEEWANYLQEILKQYGMEDGLLLDLGCGTGSMTECMATRGFDMTGVDNSPEMLEIANRKKEKSGQDILYLMQDMREFELYGTVRGVISVCDSINYIIEKQELVQVFQLVNNYLDPGGIFIFDFNTEYKYRDILGEQTIAEVREDSSFIWDNYYYEEEQVNEYELTLFRKEIGNTELYRKYQEQHLQKAYSLSQIKQILEEAGMVFLQAYDGFSVNQVHEKSERICVIAREKGKVL